MALVFITGPVRSGKSRFAERLASANGGPVLYVATALRDPADAEMEARIAHHCERRPTHWEVLETAAEGAPELADLARSTPPERTLLVDSLGTWIAARMHEGVDVVRLEAHAFVLAEALIASPARIIVVGEEVGWGIVPLAPSARAFRDIVGRVQQRLAASAADAYLVVAGIAIDLKRAGVPIDDLPAG